jgi:tetratricopeptide (TPR) repeat protein
MVQAIGIDANDVVTREQLAGLHLRRGNLEQALDLYNAVLAIDGRRPQSLMPKTEVLIALKRWDDADAAIRTILALPDQQPAGFLLSGRRHQARGEVEPAVRAFKQALALRPGAVEPATGIVQTYLAAQRPGEALAFLDEAIAARPKDAFLRNLRGEVKVRQQRVDDAMADYRAAIAEQPDWLVPYTNLGGVLVAAGRPAEAVTVYQEALAKRPGNPQMLFSLGVAQEQAGDYRGAIATFEQLLAVEPGSDVAANNYAALVADFAHDDPAKLARALEMARRFETASDGVLLDTLGWVLYRTGDYAQALIYLERAARARADAPVVQYHLGMTLYRLGDHAAARRALEAALAGSDGYPGKEEAKATLARLSQS